MIHVLLASHLGATLGTTELEVDADSVKLVLQLLCERFGRAFEERLPYCRILLNGANVAFLSHGTNAALLDGDEIILLPPMAGG